jgi:hypothetical protein
LPPAVASSDLSANHGTVTHNHNTKVLIAWCTSLLFSYFSSDWLPLIGQYRFVHSNLASSFSSSSVCLGCVSVESL